MKAADASKIAAITTTLKLNTAHRFEYNNIICAEGVSVEADYAALDHELTLKITHDGTLTGDAVLVSIPVRVWAYKGGSGVLPTLNIECSTQYGEVTYADEALDSYAGGFYTALNIATEYVGTGTTWSKVHKHSPAAIADKAATCTKDGYTGRTYCEACASVVDWGTVVPATGHTYQVSGNQLVCACGDVNTANGLQNVNGVNYYLINGELASGWFGIGEDWYYFDATTYAAVDGEQVADNGIAFVFDNGRVTKGVWVKNNVGLRYWYGPGYYRDASINGQSCKPYVIDGKTYLFNQGGYMQTGIVFHLYKLYGATGEFRYYDCGTDGVATVLNGIYNDNLYEDGFRQITYKLVNIDGDLYFLNGHKIAKNTTLYLSERFVVGKTFPDGRTIPVGNYRFDAEGKMIIPEYKHGIYDDRVYINDVLQKAFRLVELDGNFYFINDGNNKIAKNTKLYLGENFVKGKFFPDGRAIAAGTYEFDAEGKMILN